MTIDYGEFAAIKSQAGLNSYKISVKEWVEKTNAIGLTAKAGRYGGTYTHKDIAFEFASWVSVEFKLYLIKEFQRLKEAEVEQLGWDIRRNLTKINYRIHTDAIKAHLIRDEANAAQLVCLANLEILNAHLIQQGLEQGERLRMLNQTAIAQMTLLLADRGVQRLQRSEKS